MCYGQDTCVTGEEWRQCSAQEMQPGTTQKQILGFCGEGRQLVNFDLLESAGDEMPGTFP